MDIGPLWAPGFFGLTSHLVTILTNEHLMYLGTGTWYRYQSGTGSYVPNIEFNPSKGIYIQSAAGFPSVVATCITNPIVVPSGRIPADTCVHNSLSQRDKHNDAQPVPVPLHARLGRSLHLRRHTGQYYVRAERQFIYKRSTGAPCISRCTYHSPRH